MRPGFRLDGPPRCPDYPAECPPHAAAQWICGNTRVSTFHLEHRCVGSYLSKMCSCKQALYGCEWCWPSWFGGDVLLDDWHGFLTVQNSKNFSPSSV